MLENWLAETDAHKRAGPLPGPVRATSPAGKMRPFLWAMGGACWAMHIWTGHASAQTGGNLPIRWHGEIREQFTGTLNPDFQRGTETSQWTQRVSVTADMEVTPWLDTRASFLSATGSANTNNGLDRNLLDLQEAWLRLGHDALSITAGRQELQLGSQRLVGVREGTNVRRTWQGVNALAQIEQWSLQGFALNLVDVEPNGAFNDEVPGSRFLSGVYATRASRPASLDVYWLYTEHPERLTAQGVKPQNRHSFGLRSFGEVEDWEWNLEAIFQTGSAGKDRIRAWSLAAIAGRKLHDLPWPAKFTLSANIASGDADPDDARLETFDALYPRGNYFSNLALLGPANFYNINPSVELYPSPTLTLTAGVNLFWRMETEDGIYRPSGALLRPGDNSDARFVNTAVSAGSSWQISETLLLETAFAYSIAEQFLRESGPSDDAHYVELTVKKTF